MGNRTMKTGDKQDLPFPRHWLVYIILKIAVLAGAILLAFYLAGSL